MSIEDIKKRLSYIESNNLFDEFYISDMKELITKLEFAQRHREEWGLQAIAVMSKLNIAEKCLQEVFDSEGLMYVKTVLDQLKE